MMKSVYTNNPTSQTASTAAAAQTKTNLTAADLAMFRRFRIDEDLLAEAQIRRVDDHEACRILARTPDVLHSMAGIEFPHLDPKDGHRVTSKIRRDFTGDIHQDGLGKYMGSAMDKPHLYFPPGFFDEKKQAWTIVVVESQKAALAITAWAQRTNTCLRAVAVNGCWGWLGRIGKKLCPDGNTEPEHGPLPDLRYLDGQDVILLLDSNATTNGQVQFAELRLAAELSGRGCDPKIGRIPVMDGVNGPDDLIACCGDEALKRVLDKAKPANSLDALNEEFCLAHNPVAIVHMASGTILSHENFLQLLANRYYLVPTITKDDEVKQKKRQLGPDWLRWEGRNDVERFLYEPGQPPFINGSFNCWRKWGVFPVPGSVHEWNMLLDHLFGEDTSQRKWVEQWLAYQVQHPGVKMQNAVVLWSTDQGVGKSTFAFTICQLFGENSSQITESQLVANFNPWRRNKQFVSCDEVTGGDKRKYADHIKLLITNQELYINEKHKPEYVMRDTVNYLFMSNHPDPVYLEKDDRRFLVQEVTSPVPPDEFFKMYYRWLDNGGASHLFHHLLRLDLSGFNPYGRPPMTEAKKAMIVAGYGELDFWLHEQRENGDLEGLGDLWTARELVLEFDPALQKDKTKLERYARKMSKVLSEFRFENRQLQSVSGRPWVWDISRKWRKKDNDEWAELYEKQYKQRQRI